MHVRRILLIDDDSEFQQLLEQRLGPYGFQIALPADPSNPLGHVKDLRPALIIMAVELPDKVGYALCNKAKKGLARDIPVILTTRSVPASGFRSHRKLKVHADEYIDKRAMSEEEVVAKVDHLVSLSSFTGGAPGLTEEIDVEELDMVDLVEDGSPGGVEMADGASDIGELGDDDGESAIPQQIAHEGGVEFDPRELGADEDDDGSFDFSEPMHVGNEMVPPLGYVQAAGSAGKQAGRGGPGAMVPVEPAAAPTAPDVDRSLAGLDTDVGEFEADRTAVVSSFALRFDTPAARLDAAEPAAPFAAGGAPASDPVPHAVTEGEGEIEPSAPVADLDLGLDQVASLAEEEQSDALERHYQLRSSDLEKEVERLRAELEQARQPQSQPAGGTAFSREREFLNLREVINKKEKLILDLNDQLDGKDRHILTEKDRLRELDRIRSDLDAKNLELEQSLLGANEELSALRAERKGLDEQVHRQAESLSAVRADAEQLSRLLERERAQWREERDSLGRKHAGTLDEQRQELEAARTAAEVALREQQGADLRSLKEAYEETSAEKDKGFGAALALAEVRRQEELTAAQRGAEERLQLELAEQRRRHQEELEGIRREHAAERDGIVQDHATELETLTRQRREAQEALELRHREQLTRAEQEGLQAAQAAEGRRVGELAEAEQRRARDLAEAAEERARAEADLQERFESARSAMEREHAEERREIQERLNGRERELRERSEELGETRDALRAREETVASLNAVLNERDGRIAAVRQEQEELERQNAGYQEQILRAFQKIKADEATVARAKKAMAIALTLLDDAEQAAAVEAAARTEE